MKRFKQLLRTSSPQVVLASLFLKDPVLILYSPAPPSPLCERFIPDPDNFPLLFNTLEAYIALLLRDFCTFERCSSIFIRPGDLGSTESGFVELPLSRGSIIRSSLPLTTLRSFARFQANGSAALRFSNPGLFGKARRQPKTTQAIDDIEHLLWNNLSKTERDVVAAMLDTSQAPSTDTLAQFFACLEQKYTFVTYQYSRRDFVEALTLKLFKYGSILVHSVDSVVQESENSEVNVQIGAYTFICDNDTTINIYDARSWQYYDCFVIPVEQAPTVNECDNSIFVAPYRKFLVRKAAGRHASRGYATIETWGIEPLLDQALGLYFSTTFEIRAEHHSCRYALYSVIYAEYALDDTLGAVNAVLGKLGEYRFGSPYELLKSSIYWAVNAV